MLNDFEKLADVYSRSHSLPDKLYSYVPTLLKVVEPSGKTILDLGCGDGFYTVRYAETGAKISIGLDNAKAQLARAITINQRPDVRYIFADVFTDTMPPADVIAAPFLLNYASTQGELQQLIDNMGRSLISGGKVVGIVDMPIRGSAARKYGTETTVLRQPLGDGSELRIDLFDSAHIISIRAFFFTQETIQHAFEQLGFSALTWHNPIVSPIGYELFGAEYWAQYLSNPAVAYFSAEKL
ncbi:MAG: methyltransferase [Verrucomicrobiales bacterium]|nr:methyltransferase [Verrucomicrobiales bacterium]